jgi:hypothetical protein
MKIKLLLFCCLCLCGKLFAQTQENLTSTGGDFRGLFNVRDVGVTAPTDVDSDGDDDFIFGGVFQGELDAGNTNVRYTLADFTSILTTSSFDGRLILWDADGDRWECESEETPGTGENLRFIGLNVNGTGRTPSRGMGFITLETATCGLPLWVPVGARGISEKLFAIVMTHYAKVFDNETRQIPAIFVAADRATTVPSLVGQIGIETDTSKIYIAKGLTAGDWLLVNEQRWVTTWDELDATVAALSGLSGTIGIATNLIETGTATDIIVPVDVSLYFAAGGKITQSAGNTLTVNGPIIASQSQTIFAGFTAPASPATQSTIRGYMGGVPRSVCWFGADSFDTVSDDTNAFRTAVASWYTAAYTANNVITNVYVPHGTYTLTGTLDLASATTQYLQLIGAGHYNQTWLKFDCAGWADGQNAIEVGGLTNGTANQFGLYLSNMFISAVNIPAVTKVHGLAVVGYTDSSQFFDNLTIADFSGSSIRIGGDGTGIGAFALSMEKINITNSFYTEPAIEVVTVGGGDVHWSLRQFIINFANPFPVAIKINDSTSRALIEHGSIENATIGISNTGRSLDVRDVMINLVGTVVQQNSPNGTINLASIEGGTTNAINDLDIGYTYNPSELAHYRRGRSNEKYPMWTDQYKIRAKNFTDGQYVEYFEPGTGIPGFVSKGGTASANSFWQRTIRSATTSSLANEVHQATNSALTGPIANGDSFVQWTNWTTKLLELYGNGDIYHRTGTFNFDGTATKINSFFVRSPGSNLTISAGAITSVKSFHLIDTQDAAATDDLDTITAGASNGQLLLLKPVNSAHDVTLTEVGNILVAGGATRVLDNTSTSIELMWDSTVSKWIEVRYTQH